MIIDKPDVPYYHHRLKKKKKKQLIRQVNKSMPLDRMQDKELVI